MHPHEPRRPTTPPIVLIIDDVAATRSGLAQLLQLRGYDTREAADGRQGLGMLRAHPTIAAVVLDLTMPGTDGYWFRQQQLADPAIAAVPVVVFTASADEPRLRTDLRVTEVCPKPFSVERLLAVLARICPTS